MKNVLEGKADDEEKIPGPTLKELEKLDASKAERYELDQLKEEVTRLENMLSRYNGDYNEGDYVDSFLEGEESEIEDVLSLGEVEELERARKEDLKDNEVSSKLKDTSEEANEGEDAKAPESALEKKLEDIPEISNNKDAEKKIHIPASSETNILLSLDRKLDLSSTVKIEIDLPKTSSNRVK